MLGFLRYGQDHTISTPSHPLQVCGVVKLGESESSCPSWAEYCPNVVSFFRATSAFAILSLLLCVAMVFMDYYEMTRPGAFRWHHMAMTGGHHILWIFLGLTWTSFTGGWEQKCGTPDDYLEPGVRQYHSSEHMTYDFFLLGLHGWVSTPPVQPVIVPRYTVHERAVVFQVNFFLIIRRWDATVEVV